MMYTKADVIETAKLACKDRGITVAAFARECGINESQMQYYFRGKRTPKDEDIQKICLSLRVPFELVEKDLRRKDKTSNAEASGIRPEAKAIVKAYQKAIGYKYETDALTDIVFEWAVFKFKEADK